MAMVRDRRMIAVYQMRVRRAALTLEMRGMTRHGRSAYAICKEVYGLKGSRKRVLEQMDELIQAEDARLGI